LFSDVLAAIRLVDHPSTLNGGEAIMSNVFGVMAISAIAALIAGINIGLFLSQFMPADDK
jgi:hypothetical protein